MCKLATCNVKAYTRRSQIPCWVKFLHVDVTSAASVAAMLRDALAWVPAGEAMDAAIFSAGINDNHFDFSPEDPAALSKPETLELVGRNAATLNVNLIAVLQCVRLVVKYGMGLSTPQTQSSARPTVKSITLIGSLASYRSLPRAVEYSASKWGVRGMFRSIRQILPKAGVRVNMVAPGFVKTPLLAASVAMYEKLGVNFAKESDVVEAVVNVVCGTTCSGKAFTVTAHGVVELQDEAAGMDGSTVMNDLVAQGALGTQSCPMGHDEQAIAFG